MAGAVQVGGVAGGEVRGVAVRIWTSGSAGWCWGRRRAELGHGGIRRWRGGRGARGHGGQGGAGTRGRRRAAGAGARARRGPQAGDRDRPRAGAGAAGAGRAADRGDPSRRCGGRRSRPATWPTRWPAPGIRCRDRTVARTAARAGVQPAGQRQGHRGPPAPDRDAQFGYLNDQVSRAPGGRGRR